MDLCKSLNCAVIFIATKAKVTLHSFLPLIRLAPVGGILEKDFFLVNKNLRLLSDLVFCIIWTIKREVSYKIIRFLNPIFSIFLNKKWLPQKLKQPFK